MTPVSRGAFLFLLAVSIAVGVDAASVRDKTHRILLNNRADDLCAMKDTAKTFCTDVANQAQCTQKAVADWLDTYDAEAQVMYNKDADASWKFLTDIKPETEANANTVSEEVTEWFVSKLVEALRYPKDTYNARTSEELSLITATNSLCNPAESLQLIQLDSKLSNGYASIHGCIADEQCFTGQSEFANIMSKTEDYDTLKDLWVAYTDGAAGFRNDFTQRLVLLNKGARENGYKDSGYYEWFTDVGDADFLDKMKKLLDEIDPLYRQLHAYVRYKLAEKYPGKVDLNKPIPVHLTRNMYGQTWSDLIGIVKPYPDVPDTDISGELVAQNYDATKIFKLSEEFFASIDNYKMTPTFWTKSMIEEPKDKNVDCHGSAWDFQLDDDYRVKMCTVPNMAEFTTVHHEMGHIEYFMAYRKQRFLHRDGAQSGFHEAIGDTITLSVLTPEHLKVVGLLKEIPTSDEFDLNFLMSIALEKLPFFSFSLMMDLWRWATFDGSITADQYNTRWWSMRREMGGIMPPAESNRSGETYFDPGAKFHVTNNVPYVRYFMSYFLQFQFYKSMCQTAGHTGKLHRCDFYNSKPAGQKLKKLMEYGKSKNWHDQLEEMTGTREISSAAILEYFKPLQDWLEKENKKLGVRVGWDFDETSTPVVPDLTSTPVVPDMTSTPDSAGSNRATVLLMFTAVVASLFRFFRW